MTQDAELLRVIKVGYLYNIEIYPNSCYCVCIGKRLLGDTTQCFVFAVFEEDIPKDATLESYPLNKLKTTEIRMMNLRAADFQSIKCVGSVVEPTEKAIRAWITQLKLVGYNVVCNILPDVYLGDWNKRKKLPCVIDFEVGRYYVPEELAYSRKRIPYRRNDNIWYYCGKEGDKFVWRKYLYYRIDSNDEYKRFIQCEVKKQYTDMVLYNPNAEGYQV